MTGARQSCGAHALWDHLARDYEQGYVRLQEDKSVTYLGPVVEDERVMADLSTRRILLGRGWGMDGLAAAARIAMPEPELISVDGTS